MPDVPELKFAHYRVLQREDGSRWDLGRGAMGVTYKAFDEQLRVEVALKLISSAQVDDPKAQALFLREARAAAQVRHPNVASVVYLNTTPGNFFYAMEFIAGESLQDRLRTHGALPVPVALGFALQIARGLGAIHARHVVHRDLKPANLMVVAAAPRKSRPGPASQTDPNAFQIKIIDFGLARGFAGDGPGTELYAKTTGFRGTVLYASPEQCEERHDIDGRSDQYSLGCILWEMLLGAPPFRGKSHHELMTQHVSRSLPLERIAHLPASLQAVLARMLLKDPANRFADDDALAAALEDAQERIASGQDRMDDEGPRSSDVTLHASEPALALPSPPPLRTHRAGLLGAAAAAVLVFGGLLWFGSRARSTSAPPPPPSLIVAPDALGSIPAVSASPERNAPRKSVAVLPFANLSAEKENEYFADGVQEDVLTNLSRIGDLRVISRTSVMGYRAKNQNLREIARELGVGSVVEGSVRRYGNQIRISARLIDANTDERLWAENFDSETSDLFAIQNKIALQIAQALEARLTPGEAVGLRTRRTENLAAYEFYRRGLAQFRNFRREDNEQAIASLGEAIEREPKFALAYAALSEAFSFKVDKLDAPIYWLESAVQAAEYAVTLDPQCAEAHLALGTVYSEKGWYRRARTALTRALELNPNYATPLGRLALIDQAVGDWVGAWEMARRAVVIDPNDPYNYLRLGDIYFNLGEIETGEHWMRRGLEHLADPDKAGQIEIQIAHSRQDYARINALSRARRASSLPKLASLFGDMPGRGPVGYYNGMAHWHLGNIAAFREGIETNVRMANPEGLLHGRIQTAIAILRRREGRDAEMREACRQLNDFFRRQIEAGSEAPANYYNLAIGAWLLGERETSDENLDLALQAGLLIGKTDESDMFAGTLLENPKFAAAVSGTNRRIEVGRARIRELEKRYPP